MFPSPTRMFLTRGVGVHRHALTAFEFALRDADIEQQNLVERNGYAVGGSGVARGSLVKLSSASRRNGPVSDDEGADDVTVARSHDRGHEAGRLGGHDPADLPPGGEVFGEALQSVAGAAGRGGGPAISARRSRA